MKFFAFFAFALIAAASADVSHLRQYLPPFEGSAGVQAAPAAPTNQYLPPAAAAAPAPVQFSAPAEPAAATFNEQSGYEYQHP